MIIGLEGLPGSGKTSLVTLLPKIIPAARVIPQIIYVPAKNKNWRYYVGNDVRKSVRAVKLSRTSKIVIMDRTFYSTLAYQQSVDELEKKHSYRKVRRFFLAARNSGQLVSPDVIIYLSITPKLSVERKARKVRPGYIWNNKAFLRRQDYLTRRFMKKNRQKVITINGLPSFKTVARNVVRQIRLINERNETTD